MSPRRRGSEIKNPQSEIEMMEFVLATENRHKAREIGEIVAPVKVLCLLDLDFAPFLGREPVVTSSVRV
ncbi:MAG: hypothetical protein ABIH66_05790 [bacterium]